jgi:hypothetical protein
VFERPSLVRSWRTAVRSPMAGLTHIARAVFAPDRRCIRSQTVARAVLCLGRPGTGLGPSTISLRTRPLTTTSPGRLLSIPAPPLECGDANLGPRPRRCAWPVPLLRRAPARLCRPGPPRPGPPARAGRARGARTPRPRSSQNPVASRGAVAGTCRATAVCLFVDRQRPTPRLRHLLEAVHFLGSVYQIGSPNREYGCTFSTMRRLPN